MKVEYRKSALGMSPEMAVQGSEFLKVFDDEEEFENLLFAYDRFLGSETPTHDAFRTFRLIKPWVTKGSCVVFVLKMAKTKRSHYDGWCEVYVISSNGITGVITSEDGESFETKRKETR